MLVGIPNVGKSALANSLHQVGRISAAEKGRLKHAIVSPHPGETKNISGLKIASHPSIYVLDTSGVFPAEILDAEVCSNLALTGAIKDCLVGEVELAEYFLSILNLTDEYKKWDKLSLSSADDCSELERRQKRQYLTDHTQMRLLQGYVAQTLQKYSGFHCEQSSKNALRSSFIFQWQSTR